MEVKILGVSEKEWDYVDDLLLEEGNLLGGAATSSGLNDHVQVDRHGLLGVNQNGEHVPTA